MMTGAAKTASSLNQQLEPTNMYETNMLQQLIATKLYETKKLFDNNAENISSRVKQYVTAAPPPPKNDISNVEKSLVRRTLSRKLFIAAADDISNEEKSLVMR